VLRLVTNNLETDTEFVILSAPRIARG